MFIISITITTSAQTVESLINEVNTSNLDLMLNEFSGEVTTTVDGNTVTILNRVSSQGNNLAANYLKEKLNSYGDLMVVESNYSPSGRNIIATQIGETNPNNIYIICAHYDSVANYCADDNATGSVAVLETARILSQYCTDNTVIYALWDEEEEDLDGSTYYASLAAADGKNILGVINLDMIGYDKDSNNNIPIHTRNIANSLALKDDVVSVLTAHSSTIGLTPTIVNPGVEASDHASFWNSNFSSIMLTEAAIPSDLTPFYHTANDRVSTLHLPYFHKISKFLMAITATKAGIINNNNCSLSTPEMVFRNVSIYPTPSTSSVTIRLQNTLSNASIQVVNMTGQVIHKQVLEQNVTKINIANFSNGVYFFKIKKGNNILVKKIVKF